MDIRKLQRAIVDGLENVKAQHIVVFNTEHLSPLFERVIIASGASNRQTKSLAASVRDTVRSRDLQVLRTEGEENGEWIIVDCGAAVVHIMQPAIREYYHLEEIWGGKSVKMKFGEQAPIRLVKASEDMPRASEPAVSARYLAAKKAPTGRAPTKSLPKKRASAKRPATPRAEVASAAARKAPARKAPARKAAPARALAKKSAAPRRRA
ncbi:MAG TPA: ribosome silencing factor [Rubrivivax sp.]|nr:ribosome silencing factor [Rubrivivax sp.]